MLDNVILCSLKSLILFDVLNDCLTLLMLTNHLLVGERTDTDTGTGEETEISSRWRMVSYLRLFQGLLNDRKIRWSGYIAKSFTI